MYSDPGSGWQTVFADLAIILFMTTALAVDTDASVKPSLPQLTVKTGEAAPVSVWRNTIGGETLKHWLVEQGRDPRVRFTFIVRYRPAKTYQIKEPLLEMAHMTGRETRIRVEPGAADDVVVVAHYGGVGG